MGFQFNIYYSPSVNMLKLYLIKNAEIFIKFEVSETVQNVKKI